MTIALDSPRPSYQVDPDYVAAMAAFHRGNWPQAIQLLETLKQRYPGTASIADTLEDASFKAHLDATTRVRAKRWAVNWRPLAARVTLFLALAAILWGGYVAVARGLSPLLGEAAARRTQQRLLAEGQAFLTENELDLAEARFNELLGLVPDHVEAQAGLAQVAVERELLALYNQAVSAEQSRSYEQALQIYSELQTRRAHYADVSQRISRIRRWQEVDRLLDEAATLQAMLLYKLAAERFAQARSLDLEYRSKEVVAGLVAAYLELALEIIEADPPQPERLPEAVDYLDQALTLETRNSVALEERRFARLYLEGKQYAAQGNFHFAVSRYQTLFDTRPAYLGGQMPQLLYDAYVGSGDQYRAAGDCTLAYDHYSRAVRQPVDDTTVARARMTEVAACLTPTPTPSNTPLPTEPPPPSATPTPTATPQPLLMFRGKIVFKADHPDYPDETTVWVMNPDGSNRQYLGTGDDYEDQIEALRYAETFSPDKLLRVYVTDTDGRAQVFIDYSQHPQFKSIGNKALTRMTGIAYDPVWAPNGGSIAYVTQENESDDIWLMDADGNHQRALMRNDWEWDKHPSWSPDSTLIVFWSNRNGLKQVFVMDTNGKVLRNLSSVGWDEYDPIWVK